MGKHVFVTAVLVVLVGLLASPALALKTDVIVMDNGNRLVGEIKALQYGLLDLSMTDIKGRLKVEWSHVVRVTSNKQLDIELKDGTKFFGSLVESDTDDVLRVATPFGEFDVALHDVVTLVPIRATFLTRLAGDISTGISYTKATDILQFNFGGSVSYRTVKALTQLNVNVITTAKSGDNKTNADVPLTYQRFFAKKWFYRGDAGGSRNDELGIDFRGSISAGGGRRLVQSSSAIVSVSMLLSTNREFTSDDRETTNFELVLDTTLMAFRYDTPKLDFTFDADGFLGLRNWGRFRVNIDARLSLELVEDLFWDISQIYYRYDSDPSETASSGTDWGVISGIRYKFD